MEDNLIEVIEEYENGILIKRMYNGVEQLLPDFSQCKSITFSTKMSREEAVNRYGNYYKIPHF